MDMDSGIFIIFLKGGDKMKHYIAIYDEDTEYAAKLANYMKLSDIFPFVSRLCFSKEELIEVCDSCTPQIVLLSDNNCYKAEDILIGEKIHLSTEKSGSDDGKNLIFKYQSGEKIIKEILRITANSKQVGAIVYVKTILQGLVDDERLR